MKNYLLVFAFAFISLNVFSQVEYYYSGIWYYDGDWYYKTDYELDKHTIAKNSIHQITYTYNNGKKTTKTIANYDDRGSITKNQSITKKGDTNLVFIKKYNNDGKLLLFQNFKKAKLKRAYYNEYYGFGKLKTKYYQKAKHKKIIIKDWVYNKDTCLTESHYYKRNGKVRWHWKYEYYDKCKISKSIFMNGKGKIKRIYSYDCKDEGEVLP